MISFCSGKGGLINMVMMDGRIWKGYLPLGGYNIGTGGIN